MTMLRQVHFRSYESQSRPLAGDWAIRAAAWARPLLQRARVGERRDVLDEPLVRGGQEDLRWGKVG